MMIPFPTHYQTAGNPDNATIVLIHGLGLNHLCWQWHVPILCEHFYVVSYDLLGHGESAKQSQIIDLSAFSDQLYQLLAFLSIEKCHLVGFSLGGMINRRFALDHPDQIETLAILNSPHERTPEAQKVAEEQLQSNAEGGPQATLAEAIERWFTADYIKTHPEVIEQIKYWLKDNDLTSYRQSREVLVRGILELILPKISDHPTLVITAENDIGSTPQMSYKISQQFPRSKTIIVPKLKHMGLLENPQAFTQPLIDFIISAQNSRI